MRFDVITIFPELFSSVFDFGILRRARQQGIAAINIHDLRDFTFDKHQVVDDRPFGGGDGMVLKPEPLFRAIEWVSETGKAERSAVVLLTPQGKRFDQLAAARLAALDQLTLICGRYEGVDERVIEQLVTEEVSIGDYVLSGGEIPAMVVIDAVVRLLPEALGNETSAVNESFANGLLDFPLFTRPANYRGLSVPEVLVNGNHREIEKWRRERSLRKTIRQRPDLLSDEDRRLAERLGLGDDEAELV